jgi:hypothetical protein
MQYFANTAPVLLLAAIMIASALSFAWWRIPMMRTPDCI